MGEVRYSDQTTLTRYQYTGQYSYATVFGLLFYNARWYDPALGRFAQADTIVPEGVQGWDRYAYGSNNPVKYTDPTGHNYCDRINSNNAEECNAGESRIASSDSLQQLRKEHEKQSVSIGPMSAGATSISAVNSIQLGNPAPLGDYIGGLNGPGGQPNTFYMWGSTVGLEGDMRVPYPVAVGLSYNAHYDLNYYEHGTVINLAENYELRSATPWTDIQNAGTVLRLTDSHGTAYQSFLGEIYEGQATQRTTSVVLYGGSPSSMSVRIDVLLNNTWVGSAPLPEFRFGVIP